MRVYNFDENTQPSTGERFRVDCDTLGQNLMATKVVLPGHKNNIAEINTGETMAGVPIFGRCETKLDFEITFYLRINEARAMRAALNTFSSQGQATHNVTVTILTPDNKESSRYEFTDCHVVEFPGITLEAGKAEALQYTVKFRATQMNDGTNTYTPFMGRG